jgi:hypothetical protein
MAGASSRVHGYLGPIPLSRFSISDNARDLALMATQCALTPIHVRRVAQELGTRDKGRPRLWPHGPE